MSSTEGLVHVVPYTADGEAGNGHLMRPEQVAGWTADNAAWLLGRGYVRLVVTNYVPTRVVGDRRGRR